MSFLTTLLSQYGVSLLKEGFSIGLDWLGQFARVIIEGVGVLGAGIIVFTLVLKAITLPFDIYQRVKMRKQTLLMKQMKPELEKLQQTYANDKNMYNQKMMELYKKNGYSMLGACLPMIISLVILIVAFQGFRTYSQYANLKMYVNMSEQYNAAVLEYAPDGKDFHLPVDGQENDELTITWVDNFETTEEVKYTEDGIVYTYYTRVAEEDSAVRHKFLRVHAEDESKFLSYMYSLDAVSTRSYTVDSERLKAVMGDDYAQFTVDADGNAISEELACKNVVKKIGATAAAEWYRQNDAHFLWVKNIWYPDVSYQHPIQDYKGFSSNFKNVKVTYPDGTQRDLLNEIDSGSYENLVSELQAETKAPNGYFILIILSIGLMVLSQFVSMRSQKETNQYQTVDGSGAKTQKMMLVMMPLIYAVFAFMYSGAFSIYMVMSSAVSLVVTLLSNLFIGIAFKKKEHDTVKQQTVRKLPWMTDGDTKQNKNKKDNDRKNKR